jgi:hypothetical protein
MDLCLQLPLQEATKAIMWRANRLFINKKCPTCRKPFNRAHLSTCHLIPDKFAVIYSSKDYQQDLHEISDELSDKSSNAQDFYYTPLDFLLNEKRYGDFLELLDHLYVLLCPA